MGKCRAKYFINETLICELTKLYSPSLSAENETEKSQAPPQRLSRWYVNLYIYKSLSLPCLVYINTLYDTTVW